jgi:hypothetical protein
MPLPCANVDPIFIFCFLPYARLFVWILAFCRDAGSDGLFVWVVPGKPPALKLFLTPLQRLVQRTLFQREERKKLLRACLDCRPCVRCGCNRCSFFFVPPHAGLQQSLAHVSDDLKEFVDTITGDTSAVRTPRARLFAREAHMALDHQLNCGSHQGAPKHRGASCRVGGTRLCVCQGGI